MLCNNYLSKPNLSRVIGKSIIIGSVAKHYNICILLNSTGFTKVAQLRIFLSTSCLYRTAQLRKRDYRYIQLRGSSPERHLDGGALQHSHIKEYNSESHKFQVVYYYQ